MFVALAIAIRTNCLDAESITNRYGTRRRRETQEIANARRSEEIKPSKFENAEELYSGIDLENPALNDGVLNDMLVRGRYNKEAILGTSLDGSSYFATRCRRGGRLSSSTGCLTLLSRKR